MTPPKKQPQKPDEQLVTVPITETAEQRRDREKRGEPLPQFSYVAVGRRSER